MCNIVRTAAVVVIAYAALALSPALARPTYLHEIERVQIPSPYFGASHVCLEGDHVLVLAVRNIDLDLNARVLLHFRRGTGGWQFVQEVVADPYYYMEDWWSYEDLACDGPLAAMSTPTGSSYVAELIGSTWQATRITGGASHAAVHGNIAAFGSHARGVVTIELARKNSAGVWSLDYAVGPPGYRMDHEYSGPGEFAITADAIVVDSGSYRTFDTDESVHELQVFDRTAEGWQLTRLGHRENVTSIGNEVAIPQNSWGTFGEVSAYLTRDAATRAWTVKHSLFSERVGLAHGIRFVGDRAYANFGPEGEIGVFVRESERLYRHRATLSLANPTGGTFAMGSFDVDNDRVAALGNASKTVYVFRVPTTLTPPTRLQETFEGASTPNWVAWGKTDWRLATTGGSRVFRQHNTEGDARAILQTFDGTDQSIQADVRFLSLAGSTPWAGFMVRYTDPQNFYYLLVNATSVQIRRMHNGVFGPIAQVPFSLVVGRMYQFRLEAVGTRLRAFVNGNMVAEAVDATHARGRVGLTMWRTSAEYDNVVVAASPQRELFRDPFSNACCTRPWTAIPSNQWTLQLTGDEGVYRQASTSGPARAVNGAPTQDQIVGATVRPLQFNASGTGFVGLLARHVNQTNYYYGVLTQNRVSLRKVVNGVVTVLDETPYTVTPNTAYVVRLEAVGSWIRMYVGGWLMVERQDDSLKTGKYGLVTQDASATFDNFRALGP